MVQWRLRRWFGLIGDVEPYQSESLALNCLSYQDPSDAEAAAEVLVWDPPLVARLQTLTLQHDTWTSLSFGGWSMAFLPVAIVSAAPWADWNEVKWDRYTFWLSEPLDVSAQSLQSLITYVTLPFEITAYYMWWNFNVAQGVSLEREKKSDTSFPAAVITRKPRRIL